MSSHDELLEGYLAHAEAVAHERQDTNFWAFNELADLIRDDPDGAWRIVVELVGRAPDDETLGYVAAGALEDLICQHPDAMIARVESRARQDARFRKAIARVWGWTRIPKEIRARLDMLVAEASLVSAVELHVRVGFGSAMSTPGILVVTGASGSGKTATVRALEARALPGVRCYYFDAVGVPSAEDRGSGPEGWQAVTTKEWLGRLAADPDGAEVYVLDGQTRPSFVRSAVEGTRTALVRIVLLDCAPAVRHARLVGPRRQPELSNARMDCWAAYLRGQADALNLPVIDTSDLGIDAAVDALVVHVQQVRAERPAAEQQARADRFDAGRST